MKALKVTSVLLSAVMCVSMVMMPVSVFADETETPSEKPDPKEEKQEPEEDEEPAEESEPEDGEERVPGDEDSQEAMDAVASGKCGKKLKWTLDKNGTLKITGKGSMYSFKPKGPTDPFNRPWENYKDDIKKLVVSKGVTTIGKYAFYRFGNLTSVSLPKTLKIIDDVAFSRTGLTSVTVPNGVKTIGDSAFYGCKLLASAKLPDSVTTLKAYAFGQCLVLKSVNIPKNLKVIEDRTFETTSIESITIPNGVTSIGDYAFSSTRLKTVTIPASVKTIGDSAFYYNRIEKVNIPKSGLTSLGDRAFASCIFESFEVPLTVTSFGNSVFSNCSYLKDIWISPIQKQNLPENTFDGCNNVKFTEHNYAIIGETFGAGNVIYAVTNPATGGTTGTVEVFGFDTSEEKIVVPNVVTYSKDNVTAKVTYRVTKITNLLKQFNDSIALKTIVIGSNVAVIADNAFANCQNLVSVTGGAGLKTIGSKAFANCPNLKVLTINSKVLSKIGAEAFNGDKLLTTLNIKKTTKLTKGGVKNSLKGSSVKTVKVKKKKVKKYKKFFKKKNSGRSVKVKK